MDLRTLLKNFTIGFIPLFIFILVDELYGTRRGLVAAISIGIIEFSYYYFRYRQVEKFVLFDVGLIIILGGISILLDNDLFFKLKPALIELVLAALLAVHAFSTKPLLFELGKRYLKDFEISEQQKLLMRRMTRILFFVVIIHTALVIYSAYFMSNEAWVFITGGLFYIIFALVFLGQFIYMKYFKPPFTKYSVDDGEELYDIVTPKGNIIGKAPRSAVHGNPELLHPVVHLHVFNKNGQLYLQKRSKNKQVQPGKWDTAVGGHVVSGEDIMSALKREAIEELGIKKDNFQPLFVYVLKNNFESELVHTFRIVYNGPFKINREEIDFGRFWRISEIEINLGKDIFSPNFEQEFNMLQKIANHKKSKGSVR